MTDNIQATQLLLRYGANPNVSFGPTGDTPLHLAMAHPEEIVEDLLEAGATANVKNKGGITPLSTGNVSIVSIKVRVGT